MDFELPEELRLFKASLRRFVDNELIPIERQTVTAEGEEIKPEYVARVEQRAKDLGIWMMEVPEEYGGAGLTLFQRAIVIEELSRTIALPARGGGITGPAVRAILYTLTGDMKEKYLLPVLRGEKKVCFAQTEPDAGSDPGGMRTTAVRNGNHYVINGVKRFITGADKASFMQLMAATDRSKGSRGGISCFLVDMDTPGVKLTTSYQTMMGDRPWEIVLDNVRVPAEHLIGEEGQGFGLAQKWLGAGRIKHGARALVYKAATRLDKGEDAREDCYVCKYYADEMAFRAADQCMQIHGGIALTTDLPIEKMWRQQRSYRITEGASEVMEMVIARHVLKT